jgi:hypothetical protein
VARLADTISVGLGWSVQDTQHVVELDADGIQFLALLVDGIPEGLGDVFPNVGFDQLGHEFVNGFVNSLPDFV